MTDQPGSAAIAVVDDDTSVLAALEGLLASADYAVHSFASAKAMLESGCLARVDCLISDIGMPGMDGFELLRVVRAERPELPIILITGRPELVDRLPPIGPGFHGLFKKPFDAQELLKAIGESLSKSA